MNLSLAKRNYYGYLFIAPFILGFLIFGLYPVYNTFYLSFTDTTLMSSDANFIGLQNFQRLFADDVFTNAVKNTWLIWILNFIPQIGIALLISVWFTSTRLKIRAVGGWRATFFLPNLLMPAAIAALFFSLFSFYGPVNQFLVRTGILPEAMHFLQNVPITRGLVIFIQWWIWFGQTIIIVMAGMTAIPISLYEAAMVDGANEFEIYRYIIMPLMRPITLSAMIILGHISLKVFDLIIATAGKQIALDVPSIYMWQTTFDGYFFSRGAAIGILLLLSVTVLVVPYLRYSLRSEAQV